MKRYEHARIRRLAESLEQAGIAQEITEQIMQGGETIRKGADPARKADWLRGAMQRMDALLDQETRRTVREACACCLRGKRLQTVRAIARQHATLEDRVRAANEARFVFGHSVALLADGTVRVSFYPEGLPQYRCSCMPQAQEPLPITYCYCCGGHVKHHLQIALGRDLVCTVLSSALSSGGKEPCRFSFTLADEA